VNFDSERRFWVLRYEDGTFYGTSRFQGSKTIVHVDDPLLAERFSNAESTKHFHDGQGHFFRLPMTAVEIVLSVRMDSVADCPPLERSIWADMERD
jgi:hypothetical protein